MMKCGQCGYENIEGTGYCQRCGRKLKRRASLFSWRRSREWAGLGQKGSSLAPLGAMAVEKQAEELGGTASHQKLVKVSPMEDGRWYCPDCGELNEKFSLSCKGCGRDFL